MEDRSREQNEPMTQPRLKVGSSAKDYDPQEVVGGRNGNHGAPFPGKTRRWPRTLGITGLIASHLAFFLPLRAFIPVAPESDPWWGLGLVLADEILFVMVIRAGLRKIIQPRKEE